MVLSREELLVDISQRLVVMRKQEAGNYVVPDYLAPEWQQKLRDAERNASSSSALAVSNTATMTDPTTPSHQLTTGSTGGVHFLDNEQSLASNGSEMPTCKDVHRSNAGDMKVDEPSPRIKKNGVSSVTLKRDTVGELDTVRELATPKPHCDAAFVKSGTSLVHHKLPRVCTESGHARRGSKTNIPTYNDSTKEATLDSLKKLGERLRFGEDGDGTLSNRRMLKMDAIKSPRKMSLAGEKRKHGDTENSIELKGRWVGIEGIVCKQYSSGVKDCNGAYSASGDNKSSFYSTRKSTSSHGGKKVSDMQHALDTKCSSFGNTNGFDTLDAKLTGNKYLKTDGPVNMNGPTRKKAKQSNESLSFDGTDTKWQCDSCKEATFDNYDDAVAHEKVCDKNIDRFVENPDCSTGKKHTNEESQEYEMKVNAEVNKVDDVVAQQESSRVYSKNEVKILPSSSASSAAAAVTAAAAASAKAAPSSNQPSDESEEEDQINELWREKICEWCYQVVDHFDFNREVVSVAMSYLDRYLGTRTVNRRIFQLAAMTALHLAIKLFEYGTLSIPSLISLSRGYFTAEHIATMEDSMLQSLHWHVHPPTPFAFCRDLMRLVSGDIAPRTRHDINELARFLTELSVCEYWFVTKKPSSIALASLINAIELQGPHRVDPHCKVEFIHRVVDIGMGIANDDEVIDCYERLREMYIAGGYTPTLEDPSATVSPTGMADGPDSDHGLDDDLSTMECV